MAEKPAGRASILSPWLIHTFVLGNSPQSRSVSSSTFSSALPYSRLAAFADLPPERMGHQLHAVADAEDRYAELKNLHIREGRARIIDTGGPSGKDKPLGPELFYFMDRRVEREYLRVYLAFPHPAGDELRILGTEIEDQYSFFMHDELDRLTTQACNWGLLS